MSDEEWFDALWREIERLEPGKRVDQGMVCIDAALRHMDAATVCEFRELVEATASNCPEVAESILNLIDGHMARRSLNSTG